MAWKIFHIGKANDEITRLEKELANRDNKIAELEGQLNAIEENDGTLAATATELQAKLEAAEKKIQQLEAERDQLKKDLEAEKVSSEKKAAAKALEITARQGQTSIKVSGEQSGGDPGDLETRIMATTDPLERTRIYREHREAILRAAEAQKKPRRN